MSAGIEIRRARKAAKLSMDDLAERAGVSQAYLSRIETGKMDGSVRVLRSIAGELGLELSTLMKAETRDALEHDLVAEFRELDAADKKAVLRHATALRTAAQVKRIIE